MQTFTLPSNPTVGQRNELGRPARLIIANQMGTRRYVEFVGWYHSDANQLDIPSQYDRVMYKADAIEAGYIDG